MNQQPTTKWCDYRSSGWCSSLIYDWRISTKKKKYSRNSWYLRTVNLLQRRQSYRVCLFAVQRFSRIFFLFLILTLLGLVFGWPINNEQHIKHENCLMPQNTHTASLVFACSQLLTEFQFRYWPLAAIARNPPSSQSHEIRNRMEWKSVPSDRNPLKTHFERERCLWKLPSFRFSWAIDKISHDFANNEMA